MFICGSISCDTIKTSDSDIKQITYAELTKLLEQSNQPAKEGFFSFLDQNKKGGPVVLVDARTPARFAKSHLPGALSIPMPTIVEGLPELAGAKNIVVYGTTWTDPISPSAAKRMMALGYANVLDFRGGIEDWQQQGGRIESSEPPKPSSGAGVAGGGVLGASSSPATAPAKP